MCVSVNVSKLIDVDLSFQGGFPYWLYTKYPDIRIRTTDASMFKRGPMNIFFGTAKNRY